MISSSLDGQTTLPEWKQKLEERYILDAALEAGWEYAEWFGKPGWAYPLRQGNGRLWYLPDGRPARRWKAFDKEAQYRFAWGYPDQSGDAVRKPDGCDYYWMPGAVEAIEKSSGVLHITAGETDMLSMVSAGIRNVTSFFGEHNIPETFLTVLKRLAVKKVLYYPDNDETGWDAAQSIYVYLLDSGIEFIAKQASPHRKDLNELWQVIEGDTTLFLLRLQEGSPLRFINPKDGPGADLRGTGLRDFPQQFYDDVERALRVEYKGRGGWSKPLACVFASHDHDDQHPAAHWHKDKHIFRCFKCGKTWMAKEVAEQLHMDYRDYLPKREPPAAPSAPAVALPPYFSSIDSLTRYKERLDGMHIDDCGPIVFPFKALHDLGGYCRMVQPRKLIGIIGLSGGGKTSFLETLTDNWRQMGYHVLWWGPEWSWDQMADRAIQRYGGLSINQMMEHEVWLSEQRRAKNGEFIRELFGAMAAPFLVEKSKQIATSIETWAGKAFYCGKMDVTLDTLLEEAALIIQDQREKYQRSIRIVVWDYIQLLQLKGVRSDMERVNQAVTAIKTFCVDNKLVGLIASQPRKEDSTNAKQEGELLTSEAAQYMREDQFNLMMTLNPMMVEGRVTSQAVINVVKNSAGKKEKRTVQIDLPHLRWVDKR